MIKVISTKIADSVLRDLATEVYKNFEDQLINKVSLKAKNK
jgi:hypothetical protein